MIALMILSEKSDGSIKGRVAYNGKPTRTWVSREEASSPTAATESIFLTASVDAYQKRDVMSVDIPNAYIQASIPERKNGEDRIVMKLTGILVEWMLEIEPETYKGYVVMEKGVKTLYVVVTKAIYCMLIASVLWYKKLKEDLLGLGFKFNSYDPCVANRIIRGSQQTIRFHVDDILSSHIDPQVNTQFEAEMNNLYGRLKKVKAQRGKKHEFLGMILKYSNDGKLHVHMEKHVKDMIDSGPKAKSSGKIVPTPAT